MTGTIKKVTALRTSIQGRCDMTRLSIGLSFILLVSFPAPAIAQLHPSLCADCHYANGGRPNPAHLQEWDNSAHERANVGCEACHGGNPNTVESFLAHQAEVPLIEAVHAAHAFIFVNSEERLGVARARANALLERMANIRSSP